MTEIADLTPLQRRVLRALDDEWVLTRMVASATRLSSPQTLAVLGSLRRRGLVLYRSPGVTAHERLGGDWCLSDEADRLMHRLSTPSGLPTQPAANQEPMPAPTSEETSHG